MIFFYSSTEGLNNALLENKIKAELILRKFSFVWREFNPWSRWQMQVRIFVIFLIFLSFYISIILYTHFFLSIYLYFIYLSRKKAKKKKKNFALFGLQALADRRKKEKAKGMITLK